MDSKYWLRRGIVKLFPFSRQNTLSVSGEEYRSISFIGYSLKGIKRITFYAVIDKDFAVCEVFEFDKYNQCWTHELRAP